MRKLIDLTDKTFGRLIILERAENGKSRWRCRCSCGNITIVRSDSMKSGSTKSCGCHKRERSTTHGMTGHPAYNSWFGMNTRCSNKKASNYKYYGGRGIKVCERWRNSFENFWTDMGDTYKKRIQS